MSSLQKICLVGGSGFLGTELAGQLISKGKSVRVLSRDLRKTKSLRVVPSIDVKQVDPYDTASLTQAIEGYDVVINLVGILNTSVGRGGTFEEAHVNLASNLVEACDAAGITRVIQISSLKADTENGPSEYLRSKGRAVDILKNSKLDLTVFCPSVIFGNGDGLFTRFANLLHAMPFMPLACADAKFAPVYVGDVAGSVVDAIDNQETIGQSYNLCGPDTMTLQEIVEYTAEVLEIKRSIISLPDGIAKIQAFVMELVPGKPFSRDNYQSLQVDSVCENCDNPMPTSVKKIVPTYLGKMNRQSRLQHYRELARRDGEA
jgi:NADH dehydrogenase